MKGLKRFAAAVMSLLVPGAGQLAIGRSRVGLRLLLSAVTAARLAVYSAGMWGGRHLLLIVLLLLLLAALYYYSLYDLLGSTSSGGGKADKQRLGMKDGLALIGCGTVLTLLGVESASIEAGLGAAGDYGAAAGMLLLAALLYGKRGIGLYRLGRVTAALIVLAVGGLLLWDTIDGSNRIALIGRWWPAALVVLGIEVTAVAFKGRGRKLALDIGGLLLAGVVAFAAYGVNVYGSVPMRWIEGLADEAADMGGYGEERGYRYELPVSEALLGEAVRTLVVDNPNGAVQLAEGDVDRVTAKAVLWVDSDDEAEAARVAEGSRIVIEERGGDQLNVTAEGETYGAGDRRKPRINLVVTLPRTPVPPVVVEPPADAEPPTNEEPPAEEEPLADTEQPADEQAANPAESGESDPQVGAESPDGLDGPDGLGGIGAADNGEPADTAEGAEVPLGDALEADQPDSPAADETGDSAETAPETGLRLIVVNVANGSVDAAGLTVSDRVKITMTNGGIKARGIHGLLDASTKNGEIRAERITGGVKLDTFNGSIHASEIAGSVVVTAANGGIMLGRIEGDVEAETKNGEVTIAEVTGFVRADTLNGRIEVVSAVVGGNWNIGSAVGEIMVRIPEHADVDISGAVTFGGIETDLPLELGKKTVKGRLGEGTYRIAIDANSSIEVKRYSTEPDSWN